MRNALFPHMEWAKAHTRAPLPVELGFSGAPRPSGRLWGLEALRRWVT